MEVPPLDIARGFSPPGQWVFTRQYGWLFMPFDRTYTYAPVAEGGDPYMYAYYPGYGWLWLAAPWIFGIGPQPYFGTYGYAQYGWYGRGYYGHPWYGYHGGYPGGYHGIVYSHVGAWHGAENHQTSSVTHQYGTTGGQRQGGGAAVTGHPAGGWSAGVHPTAAPAYHPQPTYHPQPASHAQPSYQRPHAQTPAPAAQRRPEQEQQAPAHHSTSSQGGGKRR